MHATPRTLLAALLLLAACAQDAALPPISSEEFPEPEEARDWEDWGEARPDAPPTRGGQGGPVAVAGTRLDTAAIRQVLSGQTLRGCYPNGQRFVERLASDGRFYEVTGQERYMGRWEARDDALCFDYEVGEQADAPPSCFPVSRDGGELYFYAADFSSVVAATVCPSSQG